MSIILASSSPRRIELLERLGVPFTVQPADIDESILPGEGPAAATVRLAYEKAACIGRLHPEAVIVAADTVVSIEDGSSFQIFGKPRDEEDATQMLRTLMGREHFVDSGICIYCHSRGLNLKRSARTAVCFRNLSEEELSAYISTGEAMGKAGAYALQGVGAMLISSIRGSHTNVIGLPLVELIEALIEIDAWDPKWMRGGNGSGK